jgi:uncharacterized protein (TIGR03083 family)
VTAALPLPEEFRDRVLTAAREARPAGLPVPVPPATTPVQALGTAADALDAVLRDLSAEQWRLPVLRDLDVQGLVGHLIGVERDVQRSLAGDAAVGDIDHVVSTQPDALRQQGRPPEETRTEWRAAVDATLAAAEEAPAGQVLAMHGMRLPVGDLLVVRVFELWVHENDIRRAADLPPSTPSPATLTLMTSLAVQLLPHGALRAASLRAPVDLHLVLTGPGGGTWDLLLNDRDEGEPDELLLVADAADFCRLVADRVDPGDLALQAGGAMRHVDGVLAAAAALALD